MEWNCEGSAAPRQVSYLQTRQQEQVFTVFNDWMITFARQTFSGSHVWQQLTLKEASVKWWIHYFERHNAWHRTCLLSEFDPYVSIHPCIHISRCCGWHQDWISALFQHWGFNISATNCNKMLLGYFRLFDIRIILIAIWWCCSDILHFFSSLQF